MKKRILPLLLAMLLVSSSLAACGESASETTAETAGANAQENVPEETESLSDAEMRASISDDLGEYDFGGQAFRVLMPAPGADRYDAVTYEIVAEELTGDACNDAVYNRNIEISERFNTAIQLIEEKDNHNMVKSAVTAGTDDFDIVGGYNYQAYYYISASTLLNWLDVPNVNL